MKRKFNISICVATVAAFISLLQLQSCDNKDPLAVLGNIEGTVSNAETHQTIAGVNVSLVSNSNTTFAEQSKSTGSDGSFSFKDLEAGNYKLSFKRDGYEDNSKNISITAGQTSSSDVSLIPVKSALNVSPLSLDFGTNDNVLPVEISNSGKGEINWNIVENLAWLSASPVSGKTTTSTSVVMITVDRSQLPENTKSGSFTVSSDNGSKTVNVTIGKASSVMSVSPANLNFGEVETEKTVNVSNSGVGTLTYNATAAQSWISLEGANGSVTGDTKAITIKVSRAGLSAGNYDGSVVINSNSNSATIPVSMTVVQASAPTVINGTVSSVTHNSAQVSGTLTYLGSSVVTQHGHCWSTAPNPTTADNKTTLGGSNVLKSFNANITGLSASTTYYVRAYAANDVGTTYSDAVILTTLPPPTAPSVQTLRAENIMHNRMDGAGNITVLGDGLVTDYGFCYSSSNATPTVNDSKISEGQTSELGIFTTEITGLQPLTKYYLRAYAVNSLGTAYGTVIEATTTDAPPAVTGGLVAYYTFDNGNCNESQGNSTYNGVKQGTGTPVYTADIPGTKGKALQLNNDAYYQIATSPFPSMSSYSVSMWVKSTKSSSILFSHSVNESYTSRVAGLCIIDNYIYPFKYYTGYKDELTQYFNTSMYFNTSINELLLDNKWHMLTVTRQSGVFKLYIDAVYLGNISYKNEDKHTYAMVLGQGFTGIMDNFRAYNRELTLAEITEIFNAEK